ncbi:unnamed protein product [Brachionus calyciflorus]|uniref:Uncharacterized protein n=1 Tax=Brachionus calyciflorus TaxID=104777 RepID=A0A814NB39_9BILA|nr:unnamed protein product [Brachionus calyciflorus]
MAQDIWFLINSLIEGKPLNDSLEILTKSKNSANDITLNETILLDSNLEETNKKILKKVESLAIENNQLENKIDQLSCFKNFTVLNSDFNNENASSCQTSLELDANSSTMVENSNYRKLYNAVLKEGRPSSVQSNKKIPKIIVGSKQSSNLVGAFSIFDYFTSNWPNNITEKEVLEHIKDFADVEEIKELTPRYNYYKSFHQSRVEENKNTRNYRFNDNYGYDRYYRKGQFEKTRGSSQSRTYRKKHTGKQIGTKNSTRLTNNEQTARLSPNSVFSNGFTRGFTNDTANSTSNGTSRSTSTFNGIVNDTSNGTKNGPTGSAGNVSCIDIRSVNGQCSKSSANFNNFETSNRQIGENKRKSRVESGSSSDESVFEGAPKKVSQMSQEAIVASTNEVELTQNMQI